jgi:hypothetical protein
VDVTGYLTVRKKELQGKDNLTAQIDDNDKAFKVNLRLLIKLKVRTCSLVFTRENPFNLEHIFKIIIFKHFTMRCFKFDKAVQDII